MPKPPPTPPIYQGSQEDRASWLMVAVVVAVIMAVALLIAGMELRALKVEKAVGECRRTPTEQRPQVEGGSLGWALRGMVG